MKRITITTRSPRETVELGEKLGLSTKPGTGVLLTGDLGAGKTTIISGITAGLGVKERAKSPTFVLVWVYESPAGPVYHIDLYRLEEYQELENIGWEEMAEENCVYLVEWADRFDLPYTENAIRIELDYGKDPEERLITLTFDEKFYPNLEKDVKSYEHSGT